MKSDTLSTILVNSSEKIKVNLSKNVKIVCLHKCVIPIERLHGLAFYLPKMDWCFMCTMLKSIKCICIQPKTSIYPWKKDSIAEKCMRLHNNKDNSITKDWVDLLFVVWKIHAVKSTKINIQISEQTKPIDQRERRRKEERKNWNSNWTHKGGRGWESSRFCFLSLSFPISLCLAREKSFIH